MPRELGSRDNPIRTGHQVELFPETLNEDPPEFTLVPLDQINYSTSPPNVSPALVQSIRRNGVIVPIILDASNQVIDGRRRIEVTRRLGRDHVPAIRFLHGAGAQGAVITLTANGVRSHNIIVELEAIECLMRDTRATPDSIADRLGISRRVVHNRLRLRGLQVPLRRMVESGRLSLGPAIILASRSATDQGEIRTRLSDQPAFRPTASWVRDRFGIIEERNLQIPLLPEDIEQGVGFHVAMALVDRLIQAIPEPEDTSDPEHIEDLIFRLNHVAELIHAMVEAVH
jgi:ParB-like chromosome segregation protein Spo0J